jgi:hypothetical protein
VSIWASEWLPASSRHQICQASNSITVLQAGRQILLNFKCLLPYRFWISSQHTVTSQKTQVLIDSFPWWHCPVPSKLRIKKFQNQSAYDFILVIPNFKQFLTATPFLQNFVKHLQVPYRPVASAEYRTRVCCVVALGKFSQGIFKSVLTTDSTPSSIYNCSLPPPAWLHQF